MAGDASSAAATSRVPPGPGATPAPTVTAPAGPWTFHCTSLADGSRAIAVDTPVVFRVAPGPVGFEALEVSPA